MGTKLFSFIYNSLRKRANDPHNEHYWLPGVLAAMDDPGGKGKLLPLKGTNWHLGAVQGDGGTTFQSTILAQWWQLIGFKHKKTDPGEVRKRQPIACPSQPMPELALPTVTVYGLDNVYVSEDNPAVTQPTTGYQTVMALQFGYYQGQTVAGEVLPTRGQMHLEGDYLLKQCVCSALQTAPTVCDNWEGPTGIEGGGTYKVSLTGVFVDALVNVDIDGAGSGRTVNISVAKLTMRGAMGPDGKAAVPQLRVDSLTVDTALKGLEGMWRQVATDALTSTDGRTALIANLNAALNQPQNLRKMGEMLNAQFSKILDDNVGPAGQNLPVSPTPVANPVDQYLFDRVRVALDNPDSQFYVPKAAMAIDDPVLEPFHIDSIELGDQSFSGLAFRQITFRPLTITGLSNMTAPPANLTLHEAGMVGTLLLSQLNPGPQVTVTRDRTVTVMKVPNPPLLIQGQFTMMADDEPDLLGGTVTINVARSTVEAHMGATGDELSELIVTFTGVSLAAQNADITLSVRIDSAFQDIVNEVLNQDSIKDRALVGINQKITENLGAISARATEGVKKVIRQRLGDQQ